MELNSCEHSRSTESFKNWKKPRARLNMQKKNPPKHSRMRTRAVMGKVSGYMQVTLLKTEWTIEDSSDNGNRREGGTGGRIEFVGR